MEFEKVGGATALEIGKMQRWRWVELICGDLKVGRKRLVGGLVDPENQVDLSRWILIFALIENSHDGRRVDPGIMAISSHISLSAGSSPMLGSGDDSAASMISDWER